MDPSFFARFGLYIEPQLLDADTCRGCARRWTRPSRSRRPSRTRASTRSIARTERRGSRRWTPETLAIVRDRLNSLRETLSGHFDLELEECEKPQFLVYEEGDFFRPHMDSSDKDADEASGRRVSAVIFLNETSEEPATGAYGGGSLSFYGLLQDDPKGEGIGLPLVGSPGALVAFPSQMIHGVSPVTHGRRYTIASWFPTGTH